MKSLNFYQIIGIGLFVSLLVAKPVFAYIDPNAGGLMFQLLAAIFAVFSVLMLTLSAKIKMLLAQFKRFVRKLFTKHHQNTSKT